MDHKIKINTPGYGETPFDRAKLIRWWSQDVVSDAKVLVIGCGADGNETLKNLALMGFGSIFLADMDRIAKSNLSRTVLFTKDDVGLYKAEVAAKRVKEMSNASDCKVDYFVGDIVHKLGHGVFRRFDIVLGCLDNDFARINVNHRCCLFRKPYLDAGIYELALELNVFKYPESGCLACYMDRQALAEERAVRYSCDVFKRRDIQLKHAPTVTPTSAIVSGLMVEEAVKALHQMAGIELEAPVRYGRHYYYEGNSHTFLTFDLPLKEDCPEHYSIDEVMETSLSAKNTLGEALAFLEELLGYECVIDTYPDNSFVTTARCVACGKMLDMYRPMSDIYQEELYCKDCTRSASDGYTSDYTSIDLFDKECGLTDFTLEELGIPLLHVITVRAKDDGTRVKHVELTGDLEAVLPNICGGK